MHRCSDEPTEVNGKKFEKGKQDLFPFGNVKLTTELVHIDDATSKFDFEKFFNHITGDFEVRKMGRVDVIPAKSAPKITICSNHPVQGSGNSYSRRQFLVAIGNFYKGQDEEFDLLLMNCTDTSTWYLTSGMKLIGVCSISMSLSVFLSISIRRIAGSKSSEYQRQQLLGMIGSVDLLDFFIEKLSEYSEHGEEVFVDVLYKQARSECPDATKCFRANFVGMV